MSDTSTDAKPGASTPPEGEQTPTPPEGGSASPGGSTDTDKSGDADTISQEDARKLRSEARNLRTRLKDLEKQDRERQESEMSESQKLGRRVTELEANTDQLQAENRGLRVQVAAARLGVRPDAIDLVTGAIDWGDIEDASDLKQVERAIKQLVKDRPYLSQRPDGLDGGAGRQTSGSVSMNDLIRGAVGRTSNE